MVIACPQCLGPTTTVRVAVTARGRVITGEPCGHEMDETFGKMAAQHFGVPVPQLTGAALTAAERRRQIVEEGHYPDADAGRSDLAWMAWSLVDRAVHGGLDEATPPLMWPPDREWAPGRTPIRALVIAAALLCADIDRRLAKGERP